MVGQNGVPHFSIPRLARFALVLGYAVEKTRNVVNWNDQHDMLSSKQYSL